MEKICSQGHVLDPDRELCSRCNGPAVVPAIVEDLPTFTGEVIEEVVEKPKKRKLTKK